MNGKERNEHETLCPHCGAEAEWSFLDPEKSRIEVTCPDCGRFEMTSPAACLDACWLGDESQQATWPQVRHTRR